MLLVPFTTSSTKSAFGLSVLRQEEKVLYIHVQINRGAYGSDSRYQYESSQRHYVTGHTWSASWSTNLPLAITHRSDRRNALSERRLELPRCRSGTCLA